MANQTGLVGKECHFISFSVADYWFSCVASLLLHALRSESFGHLFWNEMALKFSERGYVVPSTDCFNNNHRRSTILKWDGVEIFRTTHQPIVSTCFVCWTDELLAIFHLFNLSIPARDVSNTDCASNGALQPDQLLDGRTIGVEKCHYGRTYGWLEWQLLLINDSGNRDFVTQGVM